RDKLMTRTSDRPLVTGDLQKSSAIIYSIAMGVIGFMVLYFLTTPTAALIGLIANQFYIFVYTLILKPRTNQNIVIGGAAGAAPVLIGWTATGSALDVGAWLLFLLVFMWTPAHFWALSIENESDYKNADFPMLPTQETYERSSIYIAIYSCATVLISIAAIAVPTVQTIFDLAREPEDALKIEVIGHQWWFEYKYPDFGITTANVLVIPEDQPVRLEMWSNDVLHNYWVPKLNGKKYLVPGQKTYLNLQADSPEEFWAQCGEYCGLSHSKMRGRVISMTEADFASWVKNEQSYAEKELPESSLAAEGQLVYLNAGCTQCHVIDGVWDVQGDRIAPNLTHFANRNVFAGAALKNNRENLTKWLANPAEIKPGTFMPNLELTEKEINALIAYLGTLK
ncbi:UbiA family prenyltransferase, partial [Acidimicrobiia bacterium]|nr:UbiA family prenyltransferase [Acidimicrobiia bacterium]